MSTTDHTKNRSPLKSLLNYLVLPKEVTRFEEAYLRRMNKVALGFFLLHPPVFVAIAFFNETGWVDAIWMSALVLSGPVIAMKTLKSARAQTIVFGITAMLMGGLLVHFGQGPVQIEMHFYFFVLLALLAVFANPATIIAAAVTVALHHAILWVVLPSSVFNYDAPFWVVAIHALFVVLESVAACFVARSYFDNVIGLEKIVQARTEEVTQRSRAMRLVLDSVGQGFVTMEADGSLAEERSKALTDWFGETGRAGSFEALLRGIDPKVADWFALGWESVGDGFLPIELCLDQLPSEFVREGKHFSIEYRSIGTEDDVRLLVVISDVTAQEEARKAEQAQRELAALFEKVVSDKDGVIEFFLEAGEIVDRVRSGDEVPDADLARWIHTLKGNTMIYGLTSIGEACHEMESRWADSHERPTREQREHLAAQWDSVAARMGSLLGEKRAKIELHDDEYRRFLQAILARAPHEQLAASVEAWKLEPAQSRLNRVAEQAKSVARRLGKGDIEVDVQGHDVRLPTDELSSFWSAFVHVVRNALDHGIESPADRETAGKPEAGQITLSTNVEQGQLVISLSDDGRGIDWAGVADKARKLGLPAESSDDLQEALFAKGVSTKEYVTEYSGRGVGMSAVLEACREMGGDVEVQSTLGEGTTMRFVMPFKGRAGSTFAHESAA